MLKEESLDACHESAGSPDGASASSAVCAGAQFRACLWLSLAADIRRQNAPQEIKGKVSC
jgi:hypothetical protein